jgi:hypothetical protein
LWPERRRIVLDEDINWKLYPELQRRGRVDATAVVHEGIDGTKDAAVFKALAADPEPFVLVTWDSKMLAVHRAGIAHHRTTIAVVDELFFKRSGRPASEQEPYIRDVISPLVASDRATGSWFDAHLFAALSAKATIATRLSSLAASRVIADGGSFQAPSRPVRSERV